MSTTKVSVNPPWPCWIDIEVAGERVRIRHTDLLAWEHAIAQAKMETLRKLPADHWHEVDPAYARR
jgi:hypothetical protein